MSTIFEPELCGGTTVHFRCPHSRTQVLPGLWRPPPPPPSLSSSSSGKERASVRSPQYRRTVCLSVCLLPRRKITLWPLSPSPPTFLQIPLHNGHPRLSYLPRLPVGRTNANCFGVMRPLSLFHSFSLFNSHLRRLSAACPLDRGPHFALRLCS